VKGYVRGLLSLLSIIAVFFAFGLSSADVLINEVMVQVASDRDDDLQWIELYNAGPQDVDVSGWLLVNYPIQDQAKRRNLVLPEGTVIPASGYLLLVNDLDDAKDRDGRCFTNQWAVPAGVEAIEYGTEFPQLSLDVAGDDLHLSDDGKKDIDAMWYGHGGEMGSDGAAPDVAAGSSLGRHPNGQDTDDPAADFIKFPHPTPGASNQSAPVTQRSTWSKIKLLFR
jgi:hypothetical protein